MLRILIVEDSTDLTFILKTELGWAGYDVYTANDATVGLQLAETNPPDVIISDIKMPGMDGLEFIRSIRKIPGLSEVSAIALTGLRPLGDLQLALTSEFNAYLVKPVEAASLVELIRKVTQKRLHRRAG